MSDEIRPDWDYRGAVEDAQALFLLGYRVAQDPAPPEWKSAPEYARYRARWEAMRKRTQ